MGYDTKKLVSGNVNGTEPSGSSTISVTFSPGASELAMIKQLDFLFDFVNSATGSTTWFVELDDGSTAERIFEAVNNTPSASGSVNLSMADILSVKNVALEDADTITIGVDLVGTGTGVTTITNSLVWLSGTLKTP